MLTPPIYLPRPPSIDPGWVRKAVVHLLGAAIAADGEVAAGAWALTLVGMVAGDVDIRVGVPGGALAYPEAGRDSGVELGPAPRTG